MHQFMHTRTYSSIVCVNEGSPSVTCEFRIIFHLHIIYGKAVTYTYKNTEIKSYSYECITYHMLLI